MTITVKCTGKSMACIVTDGCPVYLSGTAFIRRMAHSGQVNVPRQRDGLSSESLCAIVYQRCQIRQFLGTADGILAACCNACVPSGDKVRLRAVVQRNIGFLTGKYIFQCAVIAQLGRIFGHSFIHGRLDIDSFVSIIRCGQL